jgi:hypothetical protein
VLAYAAGIALVGGGGSAILTLVLGDVSTDAGSRWMTLAYGLLISLALIVCGGAAFAAVLLPIRNTLTRSRAWLSLGALLGGASAVAMAVGILPAVARNVAPLAGRSAWLLSCVLSGVVAGLVVVAASVIHRLTVHART